MESLKRHFSGDIAARIIGTTPVVNAANSVVFHRREIEILQWLNDNGLISSRWCALDDAHWQFLHHKGNLVVCKSDLACAELVITELAGSRPVQTRQACCLGDVGDAGFGDMQSRRNLAGAEVAVV